MTSTWTLKENSTGELEVTVEGEAWKKAQKKALNYAKSHMNLKGFRQGQIPDALVKKQLSSKALYDMASEEVANEALSEGIKEHNIDLVARPTLDVKEADDEKAVLVFTCTVLPEVTLGEYKGLDIKKADVEVTEEDVENEVKRVQDRYADWVVREDDDAAQLGDQVVIDFVGTKDGVAFEGGSGENYPLELGSGSFIPGFEEQVIGMKVGEEKEINVTFPEDYQAEELAGKAAVFKCTIHKIEAKELPALDDDFAKDVSEFDTLDEYKKEIKDNLTKKKEEQAKTEKENAVVDKAVENATMEIPEAMINTQVENMVDDFARRIQSQGLSMEQYMQFTGATVDSLKEQMKPQAVKRIESRLVLEKVAEAENIQISDEKLDEELAKMAEMYKMELDKFKELVGEYEKEQMKKDLAVQEAVTLMADSAKEA